jgi:hypothetical protein
MSDLLSLARERAIRRLMELNGITHEDADAWVDQFIAAFERNVLRGTSSSLDPPRGLFQARPEKEKLK